MNVNRSIRQSSPAILARGDRHLRTFKPPRSVSSLIWVLLEPGVIVGTLIAAVLISDETLGSRHVILSLIAFSLSFPGRRRFTATGSALLGSILVRWFLIVAVLASLGYVTGHVDDFSASALLAWIFATPAVLFFAHQGTRAVVAKAITANGNQRRAVIAGANELGAKLAKQICGSDLLGVRLVGFFDDRKHERLAGLNGVPLQGALTLLPGFVKQQHINLVYIAIPMAPHPRILDLLDQLQDTTASIYFVPDIFVADLIQARVDFIGGMPVVAVCETPFDGVNGFIKRGSDVVLSLLILLLVLPLMLAIAIGVKLSSPGPAIFRQRRYGLDGVEIITYKFRTMTVMEDGASITQATRDDRRVTRFGAILRKTSMDELPQFLNVLQGRMSIVGPRPHAVAHNELYRKLIKSYMVRHKVKPGITGLAQVSGLRGETETLEKMRARIEYDLEYMRNWSVGLDLIIIFRTALLVLNDTLAR